MVTRCRKSRRFWHGGAALPGKLISLASGRCLKRLRRDWYSAVVCRCCRWRWGINAFSQGRSRPPVKPVIAVDRRRQISYRRAASFGSRRRSPSPSLFSIETVDTDRNTGARRETVFFFRLSESKLPHYIRGSCPPLSPSRTGHRGVAAPHDEHQTAWVPVKGGVNAYLVVTAQSSITAITRRKIMLHRNRHVSTFKKRDNFPPSPTKLATDLQSSKQSKISQILKFDSKPPT